MIPGFLHLVLQRAKAIPPEPLPGGRIGSARPIPDLRIGDVVGTPKILQPQEGGTGRFIPRVGPPSSLIPVSPQAAAPSIPVASPAPLGPGGTPPVPGPTPGQPLNVNNNLQQSMLQQPLPPNTGAGSSSNNLAKVPVVGKAAKIIDAIKNASIRLAGKTAIFEIPGRFTFTDTPWVGTPTHWNSPEFRAGEQEYFEMLRREAKNHVRDLQILNAQRQAITGRAVVPLPEFEFEFRAVTPTAMSESRDGV